MHCTGPYSQQVIIAKFSTATPEQWMFSEDRSKWSRQSLIVISDMLLVQTFKDTYKLALPALPLCLYAREVICPRLSACNPVL